MPKDTKSLGYIKAPACESRGFVIKKEDVSFLTHPPFLLNNYLSKNNNVTGPIRPACGFPR